MTTILPILVACSATPIPTQDIVDNLNPSYPSHPNYASAIRYEIGDLIPVNRNILLPHHQPNHLVKRSPQFPIKFPLKFPIKFPKKPKKKLTSPAWKKALKKAVPLTKGIGIGSVVTKKKVAKKGKPALGSAKLLKTKAAPALAAS